MASDCELILVVDEDEEVRALVASAFERAGFQTSEAANGEEALATAEAEPPGAVVLETRLPGICGYEVCRAFRESFGDELPIVFVSGDRTDASDRIAGLLIGADDYLVKPLAADEVLVRVRQLLQRTPASSPQQERRLTEREVEILGLLAEGLSQAEIAARFSISPKTVGTHIEHILSKLDCHSRAQAVAKAFRERLVDPAV